MNTQKTILLTGTSGYIGSKLGRYLSIQSDNDLIYVDRRRGFDLSIPGWSGRLPEKKVDVVTHLAQSRRYREFPEGAEDMFQVNIASTFELLEWARKHGVKKFIFASSGTVYVPKSGKLKETSECKPSTMYASSKLCAENLVQSYSSFFEVLILRLFGTYGPGQKQMLIAETIERVKKGEEVTLASGAGIYLTPIFIDDCVKVLNSLLQTALPTPIAIINVAGAEIISLSDIVKIIEERLKKKANTVITDESPKSLCADISFLRTFYSEPMKTCAFGMEETIIDQN